MKLSWNFTREIKAILFYRITFNENLRLNLENDKLTKMVINLEELNSENRRLKNILSFKEKSTFISIPVKVVAQDASNWTSFVTVDKGRSSGIIKNSAVITEKGLVGRVIEVTKSTSKIMLLNDPDFSVAAIVQRSRVQGVVSGRLYRVLMMRYLDLEADVQIGDIVVTSGLHIPNLASFCPQGILIGKVVSVIKEFGGLSKCAYIEPAVEPRTIEYAIVILK
ncbi:MAG: rod shape-determining protein MreC [Candidatus Omnitrophota bacterium]